MVWSFVAELLAIAIFGIVIVVYSIDVLQLRDTREAGILTITLDLPALSRRVHDGLGAGSGIVKSLESELPSFTSTAVGEIQSELSSELPKLTSAAASFASEAKSVVSSAVAAAQSDLGSVVPRNCSVGTRYFCVGFPTSLNCSKLPPNISGLVAKAIPALNNAQLEGDLAALDQKLKYVTPGLIEGPLVLGVVSAVIVLALTVPVSRCLFWRKEPIYRLWSVPLEVILGIVGIVGIVICLVSSIYLPITLSRVISKVEQLQLKVEKGNLIDSSIWILSFTLVMACCLGSVCFQCFILPNIKGKIGQRAQPQLQRDHFDNAASYPHNYDNYDGTHSSATSNPNPRFDLHEYRKE